MDCPSLFKSFFQIVNSAKKEKDEHAAEHGYSYEYEEEVNRAAAGQIVADPDLFVFVINPPLADKNEYHERLVLNPIEICQDGSYSTYPIFLPLEYSGLANRVASDAIVDNWWRLFDMSDPDKATDAIRNWEADDCIDDVGEELFYTMSEIIAHIPLPDGKTFYEHEYDSQEHVVALYLIGLNIPVVEFFDRIDKSYII